MASVSSSLFRRANKLEELLWAVTQQEISSTRVCKGGQQGMSCGREQDCPRSSLEDRFSHLNPKQFIQLQLLLEPRYYISHISNTETLLRVGRELICKAFSDGVWSVWRWQGRTKHTEEKKNLSNSSQNSISHGLEWRHKCMIGPGPTADLLTVFPVSQQVSPLH